MSFVVVFVSIVHNSFSQSMPFCGTQLDLKSSGPISLSDEQTLNLTADTLFRCLPVWVHIVRRSDGTGGVAMSNILSEINGANVTYKKINMKLVLKGTDYIDNDKYYDTLDAYEFIAISNAHTVQTSINVYITAGITMCGYGFFPGGINGIFMHNACVLNGGVLAHELGHYLTLYHTHDTFFGKELVNGSNCATAGDKLCDTRADPNVFTKVDGWCNYTGTDLDSLGTPYDPPVENIMSYSSWFCRDSITPMQHAKMLSCLLVDRTYLDIDTCTPPLAVKELGVLNKIDIYPSPAIDFVTVIGNISTSEHVAVKLIDATGRVVYSEISLIHEKKFSFKINVSDFTHGVYLLQLISGEEVVYKKFIKSF